MEHNTIEVAVVVEAITESINSQIQELDDLQLSLVGGGTAEPTFA